ncbi:hypothetical protein [Methyloceanibacter sp.]|uniref:hypothetical protein n=1 Tax=Methyloceanibacter sp. TaxID=1965321 RepID=UPI002D76BB21|nr:hypothetical protein [Methyloceanibacter sp.]
MNNLLGRATAILAASVVAIGLSGAAQAAVDFTGKYLTTDTGGKPMQIVLAPNGRAWGHRPGEYMKGAWAAGKRYAVISWKGGWSTKLVKRGDHFKKFAYGPGQAPKGKPLSKAYAVKVQ